MRGRQLMQMMDSLRGELSISQDPAVGSSSTPNLKQVLTRVYETLFDEHDWPHLRLIFPAKALKAGQRYYDPPEGLDFDKIEEARVQWGGLSHKVTRGIDIDDYNAFNSDNGVTADPALKWDVTAINGKEMLEVWPVPGSDDTQFLRFKGKRKFKALIDDADICLLDDVLVYLTAAAELAPPKKKTDVQAKLIAAQRRLGVVKMRANAAGSSFKMNNGGGHRRSVYKSIALRPGH